MWISKFSFLLYLLFYKHFVLLFWKFFSKKMFTLCGFNVKIGLEKEISPCFLLDKKPLDHKEV